ncbi:MAG: sulfur oxidation c-type cytochrome SoxA [Alsobacter sp.]
MPPAAATWLVSAAALVVALSCAGRAASAGEPAPRSGFYLMAPETRAMQRDDAANPGTLWVAEGESLWRQAAGPEGRSCASCHGDALTSMRGVAARYPAFDEATQRPVTLAGRVDLCRASRQRAPASPGSRETLALAALLARQSRGLPLAPPDDPRLAPWRSRGQALYMARQGQLDLACADCHDRHVGGRLGGSPIPPASPAGYPSYRLEWQDIGLLERRLRGCVAGVRAEAWPAGDAAYLELELYLAERSKGAPMEAPSVRP